MCNIEGRVIKSLDFVSTVSHSFHTSLRYDTTRFLSLSPPPAIFIFFPPKPCTHTSEGGDLRYRSHQIPSSFQFPVRSVRSFIHSFSSSSRVILFPISPSAGVLTNQPTLFFFFLSSLSITPHLGACRSGTSFRTSSFSGV